MMLKERPFLFKKEFFTYKHVIQDNSAVKEYILNL